MKFMEIVSEAKYLAAEVVEVDLPTSMCLNDVAN